MLTLLLATRNAGKTIELQDLLRDIPLAVVTPAEISLSLEVPESGDTYAENAGRKALAYARASGLVSLGDDSGLEVDALGGAPGLFSARYSPLPSATDADRREYLLENLLEHPRPWLARFRCWVAIASPTGSIEFAEGICPGEIIPEERGTNGFGYDPIFLPSIQPEMTESGDVLLSASDKTMAELSMAEKNRLSHRARAVCKAVPLLLSLL
jgi:XTP/dITP diphosphohydrolase